MPKVGLFTITDYVNYGNRLQNYAGQEILKTLGCDVETIVNEPHIVPDTAVEYNKKRLQNAFSQNPIEFLKRIIAKYYEHKSRHLLAECKKRKDIAFRAFSKKHIVESDYVIKNHQVPADLNERYDFCVVGSDQIWNPNIRYGSPYDFLSFVSPEKRIAFSPSFGVSEIPEKYHAKYSEYLKAMAHLSVREDKGAEIIRTLSGREAQVLVDPTLVLTKQQWLAIAKPAVHKPAGKYLLTYFIGEVSVQRMKVLRKIAAIKNLEIVQMNSLADFKRFDTDPAEFIDYVRNASIVCTDSFHSCIFSIILERPFVVFNREGKSAKMSSRLDTLLGKLKLQHRWLHNIKNDADYFKIDFGHVPEIIENERNVFYNYLRTAMHIEKKVLVGK